MAAVMMITGHSVFAQMPKNDEKAFEYYGEATVKRAGSGDLQKRLVQWAKQNLQDEAQFTMSVDDSTHRFIEIDVTERLVESHYGVNRTHKDRGLSYHIKFDTDRKDYQYWINGFKYKALEVDHKGRETQHDGRLEDIKSAASKSLEEDVHVRMTELVESFTKAAEVELVE
jgi:hypothetical protein